MYKIKGTVAEEAKQNEAYTYKYLFYLQIAVQKKVGLSDNQSADSIFHYIYYFKGSIQLLPHITAVTVQYYTVFTILKSRRQHHKY